MTEHEGATEDQDRATAVLLGEMDGIGALGGVSPLRGSSPHPPGIQDCVCSRRVGVGADGIDTTRIRLDMAWVFGESNTPDAVPTSLADLIDEVRRRRAASAALERRAEPQTGLSVWYRPIHFYAEDWGIYIRREAILQTVPSVMGFALEAGLSARDVDTLVPEFVRATIADFYMHERYHHSVESFAVNLELAERDGGRYLNYARHIYGAQLNEDMGPNEEALATATEVRWAQRDARSYLPDPVVDALLGFLSWSIPQQQPGYNRGLAYVDDEAFTRTEAFLKAEVEVGAFYGARRRPSTSWSDGQRVEPLLDCRQQTFLLS